VGYHPFFLMSGVPTHYDRKSGEHVAIRSHVHLLSEHVRAGRAAGLALLDLDERVIDEAWVARKPKWRKYVHLPISFALTWDRAERNGSR
jgi:hypothetical protein